MSMASVISPIPNALQQLQQQQQPKPLSMTTKEWVIPPRPKPGRKPATDTPPTKRKAQNRAAQRAFRERRAARVGELEEQLLEQKDEHERTLGDLQERVSHLEAENQSLQSRCEWLQGLLEKERQSRDSVPRAWSGGGDDQRSSVRFRESSVASHPHSAGSVAGSRVPRLHAHAHAQKLDTHNIMNSLPVVPRPQRPAVQAFSIAQIISPPDEVSSPVDLSCGSCVPNGPCACAEEALASANVMGCGRCTAGSVCECLEESINEASRMSELKRPLPPASPSSIGPEEKRQRSDVDTAMETDYTALYAPKRRDASVTPSEREATHVQQVPLDTIEPKDSCGFCAEGTYCVCADSVETNALLQQSSTAQLAVSHQVHTPPPSESDMIPSPVEVTATGAIKLPGVRSLQAPRPNNRKASACSSKPAKIGGCGPNGPGSCAQCLADPKSGLFCRSLAANYERNNHQQGGSSSSSIDTGCCGKGGPGGCCKTGGGGNNNNTNNNSAAVGGNNNNNNNSASASDLGLSLSCAEAYKTLSSHRHFDEATDDIGSWLPKLKVAPVPQQQGGGGAGGRAQSFGGGGGGGRGPAPMALAPIEVEAASIMSVLKGFDIRFGRGQ